MTVKELMKTLENRKKGLGYKLWKQAYLIGQAVWSKDFPQKSEDACPELYPKKSGIPMPDFLREKYIKRGGR